MPEITIVIYENSLSAQNQDYLPSRSILQKEFIQHLINKSFEEDPEALVGIIPSSQEQYNDILTPTKHKDYLYTFLNKCNLDNNLNYITSLNQTISSFKQRDITNKKLIFFLGNEFTDDNLYAKLFELLTFGVVVTIVCFGEGLVHYDHFVKHIDYPNFTVLKVLPGDDSEEIGNMIFENHDEDDPELAEAIRQSIEESKKN
ncbi:26s proteasome regulatory subunit s5a [Vairimorpha apis BRL 01]|uniref:26s proteasome regulatory subunit s5a n=1 Tax=Vairimorpha apis BRL 01 TaxID=1037528 RepID=T0MGP7_9MICR|nr:26s proteasome regulatory subunit s5a [Vairimorpha apis BRL 01]